MVNNDQVPGTEGKNHLLHGAFVSFTRFTIYKDVWPGGECLYCLYNVQGEANYEHILISSLIVLLTWSNVCVSEVEECKSLQHPIISYRALLQALWYFAKCQWQLYSLVCTIVCRASVNQSLSKIQCTYSRVNARLFAPYLWILLKIQNIIFWTNWVSDQWTAAASSEQRNHELWKLQNVSNIRDKKYVDNCQWPTLDILGGEEMVTLHVRAVTRANCS